MTLKARIFTFILRNRHFFKFKLRKEVFDENTSIEKFREECEKGAERFGKIAEGITLLKDKIEGIEGEWLIPDDEKGEKIIFYVHGGGYVSGSINDHRAIVSKIAAITKCRVLLYEYRLAPENRFPAAVEDSEKVYSALLSRGVKGEEIVIAGESAGGGLALALLLYLKEKKIEMPLRCVSISPWTDFTFSGASYTENRDKCLSPYNSWEVFGKYYAGDSDRKNPFLSPLFGDLRGLPPILIITGGDEILRDDAIGFYNRSIKAGVKARLLVGKGMVHCYPLLAPFFKEAVDAMNEIEKFINEKGESENERVI